MRLHCGYSYLMNNEVTTRLVRAARSCDLYLRNWSGGGQLLFAVYEAGGEGYLGTVCLEGDGLRMENHWYKKDSARFDSLVRCFCREARS